MRDASSSETFVVDYSPVSRGESRLGEAGVIPWDSDVFGFAVADGRFDEPSCLDAGAASVAEAIARWAEARDVQLLSSRLPPGRLHLRACLEDAGFRFVETQITAVLPRLSASELPPRRLTVRPAARDDRRAAVRIAGEAFRFGRYHADPAFPRDLADRRFALWTRRALEEPGRGARAFVVGPAERVLGFLLADVDGETATIALAGVDPGQGDLAGPQLFAGALHELSAAGARRVSARLSVGNTAALNVYASLGFRFRDPEDVLHWHRPGSPHVVSREARDASR